MKQTVLAVMVIPLVGLILTSTAIDPAPKHQEFTFKEVIDIPNYGKYKRTVIQNGLYRDVVYLPVKSPIITQTPPAPEIKKSVVIDGVEYEAKTK